VYIGVTNDLHRRVYEHNHRLVPGFCSNTSWSGWCNFEDTDDVGAAIAREPDKSLRGDPSPAPPQLHPLLSG